MSTLADRRDFPIYHAEPDLVYLDSGATSLKPASVIAAVEEHLRRDSANVHRGLYPLAERATAAYEGARERIARALGAKTAGTVFTRNATEGLNLAATSAARRWLAPGDSVVISLVEHHSNLLPWRRAAEEAGATLRIAPLDEEGAIDERWLGEVLAGGRVGVVALSHVSNVLGTINPVERIVRACREAGARTVVDGAQAVPHLPVDVAAIGADIYCWSGHKALGPTGIGVLHADPELLAELPPYLLGGEMVQHVGDDVTWSDPPWRFEAGTPPVAEACGLAAALDYLRGLGPDRVRAHDRRLTAAALGIAAARPRVRVLGPSDLDRRTGVVAFAIDGAHPHDVADLLGQAGCCVRGGFHCAQPLHAALGLTGGSVRISFGPYSDEAEVDRFAGALDEALELLLAKVD
ncbi:Cysteine desulfurase [Patulibacter medicamentivorans]|uniref:cysteine desulfurase n=1 Tax=Patulibacter medicamentivorans TaxID=1097667 RepID=H0E171_9ACTN|nr:aminotransferase class V-fold PLP-dependent enzyme [Patulibacter medicamentivorans]EHN12591.1 Cysteine desulfurase [Patulibacter medicamentivorans]